MKQKITPKPTDCPAWITIRKGNFFDSIAGLTDKKAINKILLKQKKLFGEDFFKLLKKELQQKNKEEARLKNFEGAFESFNHVPRTELERRIEVLERQLQTKKGK